METTKEMTTWQQLVEKDREARRFTKALESALNTKLNDNVRWYLETLYVNPEYASFWEGVGQGYLVLDYDARQQQLTELLAERDTEKALGVDTRESDAHIYNCIEHIAWLAREIRRKAGLWIQEALAYHKILAEGATYFRASIVKRPKTNKSNVLFIQVGKRLWLQIKTI